MSDDIRSSHLGGSSGLIEKFRVERVVPSSRGVDHTNCEYFVLDPKHDPIARACLVEYARTADEVGDKQLAADIYQWLSDLCRMEKLSDDSKNLIKVSSPTTILEPTQ